MAATSHGASGPPTPPEPRKHCPDCKQGLPLADFCTNRQSKDGLHYYCRKCAAARQRLWASKHPEIVKRMRAEYLKRVYEQNATRDPYGESA